MLRSSKRILQSSFVSSGIELVSSKNALCVQLVRGVRPRKPPYCGPAKSKLFIVLRQPREGVPEPELAEIRRLESQYALLVNSIKNFCREENARHEAGSKDAKEEILAEEEAWQKGLQKIKEWNQSIAVMRTEREAEYRIQRELNVKETIEKQEEKRRMLVAEADKLLQREKELSKSYITEENIDSAIERALDDIQDFNFAIDHTGKIFKGRFTRPNRSEDADIQPPPNLAVPKLSHTSASVHGTTK